MPTRRQNLVRQTRQRKGLTIQQLAAMSDLGHATVEAAECGRNCTYDTMVAIGQALSVRPCDLWPAMRETRSKPNKLVVV